MLTRKLGILYMLVTHKRHFVMNEIH